MDKGMEESILRPTCDARDQSLALGAAGGVDRDTLVERVAKALFLAEHPGSDWSAGRARAKWFFLAEAAIDAAPQPPEPLRYVARLGELLEALRPFAAWGSDYHLMQAKRALADDCWSSGRSFRVGELRRAADVYAAIKATLTPPQTPT